MNYGDANNATNTKNTNKKILYIYTKTSDYFKLYMFNVEITDKNYLIFPYDQN